MLCYIHTLLVFILYLCIYQVFTSEFKLSESKILLPRSSFIAINYTISGSSSICHDWSSSTPEVVTVTPIYDNTYTRCSHEAVVTSVWQSNFRVTATIYAKNRATGHVVNCDVIVDKIDKLEIETRTQELYLHETPEALIARGYDSLGNTFTTLDGIPFEWNILPFENNPDYQNVLRFITWTESEYTTPKLIGNLEKIGLQGYMQLVSGLRTGAARVSLGWRDEKLGLRVRSSDVRLLVMANAVLSPTVAYLVPFTCLSYRVMVHSLGAAQEVLLPSNQYYLKVNSSDIAELDPGSSTVTAKKYGQTEVILIDKNINEDFRHPFSIIYVREPGFLSFYISPGENHWVLQSQINNTYIITVRLFDLNSHAIYMSDNLRLETTIPEEYFQILFSSKNGTYYVVAAVKEGITTLKSVLPYILLNNKTELKLPSPVEGTQEVRIYPPIVVIPKSVVLPLWLGNIEAPGYKLTAIGGSGEYKWLTKSVLHDSVTVNSDGYVKPLRLGVTEVIAADQQNLNNKGNSHVTVERVTKIKFQLGQVEIEAGELLDLNLTAYSGHDTFMSHCHWLPFSREFSNPNNVQFVKILHTGSKDQACAKLRVRGLQPGFSKVQLTLNTGDINATSGSLLSELVATITIGVYYPTKFLDPDSGFSAVAVKSTKEMKIINGPLPWILDPSSYKYEVLESLQSKKVFSSVKLQPTDPAVESQGLLLSLKCLEVGEAEVKVKISNRATQKNPVPQESIGSIKLSCTVPIRMKLVPRLVLANATGRCPFQNSTAGNYQMTISNKRTLIVEMHFIDKDGQVLDKTDSLAVNVIIKGQTQSVDARSVVQSVNPKVHYSAQQSESSSPSSTIFRSYFELTPKVLGQSIGDLTVKATSNSYREHPKGPAINLESSLNIRLSKTFELHPTKLVLYQHSKVSSSFSILHGSGYFEITQVSPKSLQVIPKKSSQGKDSVDYDVLQSSVEQTQRSGIIQIVDSCFVDDYIMDSRRLVQVTLVRPFRAKVLSHNRVQLGSQIQALVKVFDDTGNEFPSQYLHLLDLQLHIQKDEMLSSTVDNVITVHSESSNNWRLVDEKTRSGFLIKIFGENIGFASIFIKLGADKRIFSNVVKIEVFPGIRLIPSELLLLPNAEYQLTTSGGPSDSTGTKIVYSIVERSSAEIRKRKQSKVKLIQTDQSTSSVPLPSGLVRAIEPGELAVYIRATLIDADPANGSAGEVLSEAQGKIGVVQISGVEINAPTSQLLLGNSMPVWVTFQLAEKFNELSHLPITGASMTIRSAGGRHWENLPTFQWSLNPPQGILCHLQHLLTPVGVHVDKRLLHSGMRLNCSAGSIGSGGAGSGSSTSDTFSSASVNGASSLTNKPGTDGGGKQSIQLIVTGFPTNWLAAGGSSMTILSTKFDVMVLNRLSLLNPVINTRSLLLPPAAKIPLRTTLDSIADVVTFSIFPFGTRDESTKSRPLGSRIHSNNFLETTSYLADGSVEQFILTAQSTQGKRSKSGTTGFPANQTLAFFVTVKQPTYVMVSPFLDSSTDSLLNLLSKFSSGMSSLGGADNADSKAARLTALPLGGLFDFQISSHDELGDSFDYSPNQFYHRAQRYDNIALRLTSESQDRPYLMQMQCFKSGLNTIQIYGGSNGVESQLNVERSSESVMTDIISIPTDTALKIRHYQQNDDSVFVEGMRVSYSSPMLVTTSGAGEWRSSDPEVARVIPGTNWISLRHRGTASLYYKLLPTGDSGSASSAGDKTAEIPLSGESEGNGEASSGSSSSNVRGRGNVLLAEPIHVESAGSVYLQQDNITSIERFWLGSGIWKQHIQPKIGDQNVIAPLSFNLQTVGVWLGSIYLSSGNIRSFKPQLQETKPLSGSGHILTDKEWNPFTCSVNCVSNPDLTKLIQVDTVMLPTKFHSRFGIRQWGCLLRPVIFGKNDSINNYADVLDTLLKGSFSNERTLPQLTVTAALALPTVVKSLPVSLTMVIGYSLQYTNKQPIKLSQGGQVSTLIRLLVPKSTKLLAETLPEAEITVVSSNPQLLEVLHSRPYDDDNIYQSDATLYTHGHDAIVYPIKVAVTNRVIREKLEIVISLPLTRQQDRIPIELDLSSATVSSTELGADGDITQLNNDVPFTNEHRNNQHSNQSPVTDSISPFFWLRPLFYVVITAIIAVLIVILVMYVLQPMEKINYQMSASSGYKPYGPLWYGVGNNSFFSPNVSCSPIPSGSSSTTRMNTTQHVWGSPYTGKEHQHHFMSSSTGSGLSSPGYQQQSPAHSSSFQQYNSGYYNSSNTSGYRGSQSALSSSQYNRMRTY